MATVREIDSRLQETLSQGHKLMAKLKRKQAELVLLRQTLPKSKDTERAELLELCDTITQYQIKLKAELHAAGEVANKIEGRLLWKDAVRSIWGDEGLRQCYAYMQTQEVERAKLHQSDLD